MDFATIRFKAIDEFPYMAAALWLLQPIPCKGMGSMACDDGWRVYYDPDFIQTQPLDVLVTVLVHELNHLLRDHPGRGRNLDDIPGGVIMVGAYSAWNVAGDLEINPGLEKCVGRRNTRMKMPQGAAMPSLFGLPDGLLMEEYYEKLKEIAQKKPPIQSGGASEGKEKSNGGNSHSDTGNSAGQNCDGNLDDQKGHDQGPGGTGASTQSKRDSSANAPAHNNPTQPQPVPGAGACGSCADGNRREYEESKDSKTAPPPDDFTTEYVRSDVAQKITEAPPGTTPGELARWAKGYATRRLPWKQALRVLLRSAVARVAGAVDYTYSRPSRRSPKDVILPSLYAPSPEVAVVLDSSGSMDDDLVAQALGQIGAISQACGGRYVTVHVCDTCVHYTKRTRNPAEIKVTQRGGTNMCEGIRYAIEQGKPKPNVVVVLTDCATPWPDKAPNIPIIVGAVSSHGSYRAAVPKWAKVLDITRPAS